MFSLFFNVTKEEIPLLRESLASEEKMVYIPREILARTKNAVATWVVQGRYKTRLLILCLVLKTTGLFF